MPFQFSKNTGGAEHSPAVDLGLLLLRAGVIFSFSYYQAIQQSRSAWGFLTEKTSWGLSNQIQHLEAPFPGAIAVILILLIWIGLIGLFFGFLTRISALLLLACLGFVFILPLTLSITLNPQALLLYFTILICLAVAGGGRMSLDYYLSGRRNNL